MMMSEMTHLRRRRLAPQYDSESSRSSSFDNDASKGKNSIASSSSSSPSSTSTFKKTNYHYQHQPSSTTSRCSSFNSTYPLQQLRSASLCFNAPASTSWLWTGLSNRVRKKSSCCRSEVSLTMAAQGPDLSVPVSSGTTRKKELINGHRKREELEREVSMLQRLLNQEEKLHEILEAVHNRRNVSSITIPSFLPPKDNPQRFIDEQMKELLAELAMVEGEIARLEYQISHLQSALKHENVYDSNNGSSRPIQQQQQTSNRPPPEMFYSTYTPSPSPLNRNVPERVAIETKALHFISKAMKGDYNLKDFSITEKIGNPRSLFADQKENSFIEEGKFSRQAGRMAKPSSPFRDPRHPTPKPREQRQEITPSKSPLKPRANSVQSEEKIQKWEPNKLSENIMKCLVFIYIRLLRTSRLMELEKSGMVSRTMQLHSSLNSRSFRAETGLNSKSNTTSQKESRQSDPYGIFDTEESIPRDIGPYKNLVRFTSSSLDSKCISSSSSVPLLKKLRELMTHLQSADLRLLTDQQKLAFWINMYNACVMHGFLQYGVPSTPEKLLSLLNKATLNIGGNTINAQAIEYFILRKASSSNTKEIFWKGDKDTKEAMVRELYGLQLVDPNVAFALCCGTRSSPAVRIYTAEGVLTELEKSKLEYLQASIIVTSTKRIAFPELLLRNAADFVADTGSLVEWVCQELPTSGTLRKSMVDCFRGHGSGQVSISVEKIPYDYEFQYLLAM